MERRRFLSASAAAIAAASATHPLSASSQEPSASNPHYLEWIRFEVLNNSTRGDLQRFLADVVVPALNRAGCSPIGIFRPKYGAHGGDIFMLVPHSTIASFLGAWNRLTQDQAYLAAADTEMDEPLYERMTTSLMVAFSGMPEVEVPASIKGKEGRIFELRTYEAHNRLKLDLKVEMFNDGGEIQIFRETGLHPVFFGKTLCGDNMPNLTYMLGFTSMEQRDAHWSAFSSSPAWAAIKDLPRYKGTVSTITDTILSPVAGSQI